MTLSWQLSLAARWCEEVTAMFYKFFDRNAHIGVVLALLIQLLFVPSGTVPAESKVTTAGCTDFEPVTLFSDDFQDG